MRRSRGRFRRVCAPAVVPGFDRTFARVECVSAPGHGGDRGPVYPAAVRGARAGPGGRSAGPAVRGGTDFAGDDASSRDAAGGRGDACRSVAGVGGRGFVLVNCHFTRVGGGFGEPCGLGGAVAAANLDRRAAPPHSPAHSRRGRRKHLVQCEWRERKATLRGRQQREERGVIPARIGGRGQVRTASAGRKTSPCSLGR